MRSRPKNAQAYVRFYLALCWMWMAEDAPVLTGVHWWDDWLLKACVWFHNWFVAPFQPMLPDAPDAGFPIVVIEVYDKALLTELDSGGHIAE